jgi:competence protein ComEA
VTRLARAVAVAGALAAALPAHAKGKALAPGERVDLNRAPVVELMRLPGVGRKRAEAIAAARDRRPFRRVDDLAQVKGISPGWIAKHRAILEATAPPIAAPAASGPKTSPPRGAATKP